MGIKTIANNRKKHNRITGIKNTAGKYRMMAAKKAVAVLMAVVYLMTAMNIPALGEEVYTRCLCFGEYDDDVVINNSLGLLVSNMVANISGTISPGNSIRIHRNLTVNYKGDTRGCGIMANIKPWNDLDCTIVQVDGNYSFFSDAEKGPTRGIDLDAVGSKGYLYLNTIIGGNATITEYNSCRIMENKETVGLIMELSPEKAVNSVIRGDLTVASADKDIKGMRLDVDGDSPEALSMVGGDLKVKDLKSSTPEGSSSCMGIQSFTNGSGRVATVVFGNVSVGERDNPSHAGDTKGIKIMHQADTKSTSLNYSQVDGNIDVYADHAATGIDVAKLGGTKLETGNNVIVPLTMERLLQNGEFENPVFGDGDRQIPVAPGEMQFLVGGNITVETADTSAKAVDAEAGGGVQKLRIGGNVTAKNGGSGEAYGIKSVTYARYSSSIKVDGDVSAEVAQIDESGMATGVQTWTRRPEPQSDVCEIQNGTLQIGGSVHAKGMNGAGAIGVQSDIIDGESGTSIDIGEDICAQTDAGKATGLHINMQDNSKVIKDQHTEGSVSAIHVGGSVQAVSSESAGINDVKGIYISNLKDTKGNPTKITQMPYDSVVNLQIAENLESDGIGIQAEKTENTRMNVVINNILKAAGPALLIDQEMDQDQFSVTAWKIENDSNATLFGVDTDPNGTIAVSTADEDQNKAAEYVHYLIRVEDPTIDGAPIGAISLLNENNAEWDDQVNWENKHGSIEKKARASENDKVYVKIDIPSGYQLAGAYSDPEQKYALQQDDEGRYYFIMPRGGGVCVSAQLVPVTSVSENSPSGTGSKDDSQKPVGAKDNQMTSSNDTDHAIGDETDIDTGSALKNYAIPFVTMRPKGKNGCNMEISWQKVKEADGYEIYFAKCDSVNDKNKPKRVRVIKKNSITKWTKKGLKKNTAYKAYVKAFVWKDKTKKKKIYISKSPMMHTFTSGGNQFFANAKKVSVKKKKVKVSVGKQKTIRAKIKSTDSKRKVMSGEHVKKIRYISTNKEIASVSKKGRIKGKGRGTCYIYVYAHNGVYKKVKVTVF